MKHYKKIFSCIIIAAIIPFLTQFNTYASDVSEVPGAVDVFCPTDYPFLVFDNESGGRQLTSQIFYIANFGDEDIVVDLSNAGMTPAEGIACRELSEPVDNSYQSDTKDIFAFLKVVDVASDKPLTIDMLKEIDIPMEEATPQKDDYILTGTKKESSYQIVLKAANHDENGNFVSFNPESIFSFYIAGSTTPNKNLTWNYKDISFHIDIKFHILPEESTLDDTSVVSSSETIQENIQDSESSSQDMEKDIEDLETPLPATQNDDLEPSPTLQENNEDSAADNKIP